MHSPNLPLFLALLLGFAGGVSSPSASATNPAEFLNVSVPGLPGRLYVPPEAQDSSRPVVLFLHGAGETGADNTSQINGNIDNLFSAVKAEGAFLYAPQATTVSGQIYNWNDASRTALVMAELENILATMNTDIDRVYITGLSMGGGGVWSIASRNPGAFAAALPIAGVQTPRDFRAANLLGVPTWAFHARNDPTVSVDNSRNVVNGILTAAGESPLDYSGVGTSTFEFVDDALGLRYTEYASGGHQIWSYVYGTPATTEWLFSQVRTVPEPTTATLATCALVLASRGRRRK